MLDPRYAAVVTGAASGIGKAMAQMLLEEGCAVLAVDRLKNEDLKHNRVAWHCGDLTNSSFVDGLFGTCCEAFSRCDVLINNAGRIAVGTIEEIDIDAVCTMMRTNVEATIRCLLNFTREFMAQGSGDIVNTSSVLGTKIRPTAGAYAATKHAIEAISEALRIELAVTDVRISCIEPGLVATNLHRDWNTHPKDSMDIPTPLDPSDVAEMARFILNQERRIKIPRLMLLPKHHVI